MQFKKLAFAATVAAAFLAQNVMAETTVRFGWWGGSTRHQATLAAIKLFEAKNPGVKIKAEYSGWQGYQERLTTQISGNSEPDVMQINWAWISTYSKKGDGFADLNKFKNVIKLDEFPNESYKTGMAMGKLNALPVSFTARVYLLNKSTYDKAGIPLPKTWDQLFQAGKAISTKLGKDHYAVDGDPYDVILMSHAYIYQKTGKPYIYPNQAKVALTMEEAQDWVSFYKRLSAEHVVVPLSYRMSAGGGERPTEQQQDWVNGKWAGNYTWDSTIKLRMSTPPKTTKFDVSEFITMPGAKNSGMFGRPSLMFAVSKNSKNQEIAAKFINFLLTDPEAIKALGVDRGIPLTKTGFDVVTKAGLVSDVQMKAFEQIKNTKIDAPSPLFESTRMQAFLREVFEQVAFGKIDEKAAADRLVNEGNQILRRLK